MVVMVGPRALAAARRVLPRVSSPSARTLTASSPSGRPSPSITRLASSSRLSQLSATQCLRSACRRGYSTGAQAASAATAPETVTINGKTYATDSWFNVPPNVLAHTSRKLHLQKDHPVAITRQIIESVFDPAVFSRHNDFDPVVSTFDNFDSLEFPADHPGRRPSDTYYINQTTLLRTHTSAHELALFRDGASPGKLISADVYRRDEVDRSHYPVFHQMEGMRVWDRPAGTTSSSSDSSSLAAAILADLAALPSHDAPVEDPKPPFDAATNPLQAAHHSPAEAAAVVAHLKRTLELMVLELFRRADQARGLATDRAAPPQMRWVEAYFPFTAPSWELEVLYNGDWLEVLGCGVTQQQILVNAARPGQVGWAFGLGLDRLAMLLFRIPDIRLFWSADPRFLGQFAGVSDDLARLALFEPFSKYPACPRDVSFWLGEAATAATAAGGQGEGQGLHPNDVMEVIRSVAGDSAEDVKLVDEFTHPKTGRRAMAYRIVYRSLERTLTNEETNRMHAEVERVLVERFGVQIR